MNRLGALKRILQTKTLRGRESVEGYEPSGRPKEDTTDENVELVQSDHVRQEERRAW